MKYNVGDFVKVRVGGMWREGEVMLVRGESVKVRFPDNCCKFRLYWGWFSVSEEVGDVKPVGRQILLTERNLESAERVFGTMRKVNEPLQWNGFVACLDALGLAIHRKGKDGFEIVEKEVK